jgi:RHS repeat-associated protein
VGAGATRIYFAGKVIGATGENVGAPNGGALITDRLGSVVYNGNFATYSRYYPYGEEYTTSAQNMEKFGTSYRDTTSGLDYGRNRYYSSVMARFMSADPYVSNDGGSGDPADPGSWNRYGYTRGDPVNHVDMVGLDDTPPPGFTWNPPTPVPPTDIILVPVLFMQVPQNRGFPTDPAIYNPKNRTPLLIKKDFYANYGGQLNDCIKSLFGKDAESAFAEPSKRAHPERNENECAASGDERSIGLFGRHGRRLEPADGRRDRLHRQRNLQSTRRIRR